MSKRNLLRVKNLRAVAARYESQNALAGTLGFTPSYLSQLIGPNPLRPISEKTARQIEQKLGLAAESLDSELPPPELKAATSDDLIDNVMLTVDLCLSAAGWQLPGEKYRALVSYLHRAAAKRGDSQVDSGEVNALLKLVR